MNKKLLVTGLLGVLLAMTCLPADAQLRRQQNTTVTYEELYDEPYEINKLFIMFQPLYGELFATNVTLGFGLEAQYYWDDKFDFRAHGRKSYHSSFDFYRDAALKNADNLNTPQVFNLYEFGATYHIVDKEVDGTSKMFLYSKRYKGRKWASMVPKNTEEIPMTVRKVYGARLGGLFYNSAFDMNRVTESQEIGLTSVSGEPINPDASIYGNIDVKGLYVGGSLANIRNFAVKPDRNYNDMVDDLMFTAYLDILIAPWIEVEDIFYNDQLYPADEVKTNMLGFRLGMEGKFNRTFGWAYGAELGMRPGLNTKGFYALFKISFPVYSTSLDYSVEAFGK
ncbi:hypothetical protein AB9P05_15655 [Roseivirga sp. BDSF3-8]|uniref:hypothetical protein n=1 Tax=Roseivirga sp. BDSF3-8 TaxID=3241598 RepID=UPI003531B821